MEYINQSHSGSGDNVARDKYTTINYSLGKSAEYVDLLEQINQQKKLLNYIPKEDTAELLDASERLNKLVSQEKQFRNDVIQLYEDFIRIDLNTERLVLAKQHFDAGDFKAVRDVLDSKIMESELVDLLAQKDRLKHSQDENKKQLTQLAQEFLIKARATAIDYEQPDHFEQAKFYFEQSLRAVRDLPNLRGYARFLQEHNELDKAEVIYEEMVELASQLSNENPQIYSIELIGAHNNFGELYRVQHKFVQALSNFEKSLAISRRLAGNDPNTYRSEVARTLNNLGLLYCEQVNYDQAILCLDESLEIRRDLAQLNPKIYLPDVAQTLNNLGALHKENNMNELAIASLEESLDLRRTLAKSDPGMYLPKVAQTLNNLASLYTDQQEGKKTLALYEESLEIRRKLAQHNPQTYLPELSSTARSLSMFFQNTLLDKERSLAYAKEALQAARPFLKLGSVQIIYDQILQLIRDWGEDPQAFV